MKIIKKILIIFNLFISSYSFSKIKVGITLLPYYSFVKNIVKDKMEVIPIITENADVHSYQANSNDIKKMIELDYIVLNGIGHDEFVYNMIDITKKNNSKLKVIYANKETTLLNVSGQKKKGIKNPHTFISIQQAIEQITYLSKEFEKIDAKNKDFYRKNAIEYSNKLRKLKRKALEEIKNIDMNIKIATTHGGYDYLLNEFGLTVSAVVEPTHGQSPNAKDIKDIVDKIKKEKIEILFDELGSNGRNASVIQKETNIKIAYLSHLTSGKYTEEAFEEFIKYNLKSITNSILEIKNRSSNEKRR